MLQHRRHEHVEGRTLAVRHAHGLRMVGHMTCPSSAMLCGDFLTLCMRSKWYIPGVTTTMASA